MSTDYRNELIHRVLCIPASLCPFEFVDFTLRGESQSVIKWNETMIQDAGFDINKLRELCVILENRMDIRK